ncbi:MAG: nucleotidyltransferase domain-containing protein [bacterium]
MRLSSEEISAIKSTIMKIDLEAKIYLFGSRVDDTQRGGDIDILIWSNKLTNEHKRKIRLNLYELLGEQKIDLIIAKDTSDPFVRIALSEGVPL